MIYIEFVNKEEIFYLLSFTLNSERVICICCITGKNICFFSSSVQISTCIAKRSLLHWFNFTYIFFFSYEKCSIFLFAVRIKCNYSCMLTRYMHIMLHEFLYWGRKNKFHKKWINIAEPWTMVHDIVICLDYVKISRFCCYLKKKSHLHTIHKHPKIRQQKREFFSSRNEFLFLLSNLLRNGICIKNLS